MIEMKSENDPDAFKTVEVFQRLFIIAARQKFDIPAILCEHSLPRRLETVFELTVNRSDWRKRDGFRRHAEDYLLVFHEVM